MLKKSRETKNGKGVIEEGFEFWPQRFNRALSIVSGSSIDLLAPIWLQGGLWWNFKREGKKYMFRCRRWLSCGGGSGAAVTMVVFFFGRPFFSSPVRASAVGVMVPWNAMLKFPHRVDLDLLCRNMWPSLVCWISHIWKMNLGCTIGLRVTVRLCLKEKYICAVCAREMWFGPSDC